MGNFEKLSVLVIVVIIVMILVVALYTWTDKPSEDTELAKASDGTELPIRTGDEEPQPDMRIPDRPGDAGTSGGTGTGDEDDDSGEIAIHIPENLPELPRVGPGPEVVSDADVEAEGANEPWIYSMKRGETLSVVCNRELGGYYKHLSQLKTLNPGVDFDRIREGQQITMPPRGREDDAGNGTIVAGTTPAPGGGGGVPGGEYVVQRGDSLKTIAKRVYGDWTVWPRIYAKNLTKITNPDYPTPGTTLTLPTR